LQRLNLNWEQLTRRHPRLCMVAILGYPAPEQERAGHDLTYQAWLGLVDPGHMPRTLIADLAGAEQAINAALALLLGRERGLGSGYAEVSLAQAAEFFTQPLRHGATAATGPFGGGLARYGLYQAKAGWIALAALEDHFSERLKAELGLAGDVQSEELQRIFLEHTAEEWEAWGLERDVPILAVRG
jgi:crotonobetainyl-CoA:carnitine CoA-transferase CaiB-like acyl-CoA transferase